MTAGTRQTKNAQMTRNEEQSLEGDARAEIAREMVPGERLLLEVLERRLVEELVLNVRDVFGLPTSVIFQSLFNYD